MKTVKLTKDWGPHKAGEAIEVDDERAEVLIAYGRAEGEVWTPDNLSDAGKAAVRATGATFRKGRGFEEGKKKS